MGRIVNTRWGHELTDTEHKIAAWAQTRPDDLVVAFVSGFYLDDDGDEMYWEDTEICVERLHKQKIFIHCHALGDGPMSGSAELWEILERMSRDQVNDQVAA